MSGIVVDAIQARWSFMIILSFCLPVLYQFPWLPTSLGFGGGQILLKNMEGFSSPAAILYLDNLVVNVSL